MSVELNHDELLAAWMPLYLKRSREVNWRTFKLIEQQERAEAEQLDAAMKLYFQHVKRPRN